MKTKHMLLAAAVLVSCLSAARAQSPARALPAGTIACWSWAGQTEALENSAMGQLLADEGVQQALAALEGGINAADMPEDQRSAVKNAYELATILLRHKLTVALLDVAPAADGNSPPAVQAVLLATLGEDRPRAEALINDLLALAVRQAPVEITQEVIGGITFKTADIQGVPFRLGFSGGDMMLAVGNETVEALSSVAIKGSLAASRNWTDATAGLDADTAQSITYVNVERALPLVMQLVGGAAGPQATPMAGMAITALGLDKVTAYVETTRVVDKGFLRSGRLLSPGPHAGLLKVLGGEPLPGDTLAWAPADSLFAGELRLDPSELLTEIRAIAGKIDPQAQEQFDQTLAMCSQMLGVDIQADLIATLGDRWSFASAPSLGGLITGSAIRVQLKDAQKFAQTLTKLEQLVPGMTEGNLAIRQTTSGDTTLHQLDWQNAEDMGIGTAGFAALAALDPTFAVQGDRLVIALWPQVAEAALQTPARALTAEDKFRSVRRHLSPDLRAVSYADTPAMVKGLYGLAMVGWSAVSGLADTQANIPLKPEMLPALAAVMQNLEASIAGYGVDERGMFFQSYSTFGGVEASVLANSVSALLPALTRARGLARSAASMSNLKSIGMGLMIYSAENDNVLPNKLTDLITESAFAPQTFFSPASGREPILDESGIPTNPLDYVFVAPGLNLGKVSDQNSFILAYEKPQNYGGKKTVVLFADGHIESMEDMAEFHRLLEATQDEFARIQDEGLGVDF